MRHDGQPLSSWFDAAYWRALNPSCTVSAHNSETAVAAAAAAAAAAGGGGSCSGAAAAAVATTSGLRFPPAVLAQFQERIDVDGYVDLNADLVAAHCPQYPALIGRLRGAVEQLVAVGWPATFIVVYNEAWELAEILSEVMSGATGGNRCMMDLVAWHVDPSADQAGFTPHRDRHLGLDEQDLSEVESGFRKPDGCSPRDSTCWISLADASPDNGCMYFIPKSADPGYCRGDYSASHRGGEGAPPKPGTFELIRGPLGASLYSPSTES
eukprot:gene25417-17308_t